jgi:DNA-binding transcriptional MerR regulator/REP element-mobilizing transposase RayT
MRYKIKDISKIVGLSRSTLLYYERIGLINPEKDYQNDYRLFSREDVNLLKKICTYRDMGVSLNEIKNILNEEATDVKNVLEKQLININEQIKKLRNQQNKILEILKIKEKNLESRYLNKETWVKILRKSGFDDEGMENWHKEFEKNAPEAHQDFLESLGLSEDEIKKIRMCSTSVSDVNVAQASSPENKPTIIANLETVSGNSFHNLFQSFNYNSNLDISHRNLPHWEQLGTTYFVTFRLWDSIPQKQIKKWNDDRNIWLSNHTKPYNKEEQIEYSRLFSERINHWLDQGYGDCILKDEKNADIVEKALNYFNEERYFLGKWVIMPNHVHFLLIPINGHKLNEIMHSIKSFTAHEMNKAGNIRGKVWQDESYDHIVRSEKQLYTYEEYIINNPLTANLKKGFKYSSSGVPPEK